MKTTFRLIIPAVAAIAVSASCTKGLVNENPSVTSDEVRVISVQFDNPTKSILDGLQPKFVDGDKVLVSNGVDKEECTVSVTDNVAKITTSLTGALKAVYPSTEAKLNGNAIEGVIVPDVQDGCFANANIAMATDIATRATFRGQTALFEVTPPAGVTSFTITSLRPIVSGHERTGTAVAINTEGADNAARLSIKVSALDSDGKAYVSICPGAKLSDLSFEYKTDDTYGAMKGIPVKDITAAGKTDEAAANTKYTISNKSWHPYVKIWSWISKVNTGEPRDAHYLEFYVDYVNNEGSLFRYWGLPVRALSE